MSNQRISIKDIAAELGVSITTVSWVINGKAKEKFISKSVTKKIEDLVAKKGYVPNSFGQGLRTGKSKTIGFIVDDISEPFFSEIARHVDEKVSALGFKIIFSSTGNDKVKASGVLETFFSRNVDGYIISVADGLEDSMKEIINSGIPAVLFDRELSGFNTNYVGTDNEQGAYIATKHLIENGFKHIGFISLQTNQNQMINRFKGYEKAVKEHNLFMITHFLEYKKSDNNPDNIINFLNKNPKIDAILFGANYITLYGLKALRGMGLKIQEDIGVVSFDDFEILEFCSPQVTAISQPIADIAESIVKVLFDRMNIYPNAKDYQRIILSPKLIIRGSSLPKIDGKQIC